MGKPQATVPPWHLWGNTQLITTRVQLGGPGILPQPNMNTLCRVAYGRPETWHWVFQARLVSGPNNTPGSTLNVLVNFNVALGVGRSNLQIAGNVGTQSRPLESFTFIMGPASPGFPANAQLFSTGGKYARLMSSEAIATEFEVQQIVADTIVCEVNVTSSADAGNVLALGQPVQVEVSAQFAPIAHVRPDWYELEPVFSGETEGR